jgi:hypothetical protein
MFSSITVFLKMISRPKRCFARQRTKDNHNYKKRISLDKPLLLVKTVFETSFCKMDGADDLLPHSWKSVLCKLLL